MNANIIAQRLDANTSVINFYRTGEPFGEFSNFARYPIELDGKTWKTTEHYFQVFFSSSNCSDVKAQKFVNTKYEEDIQKCATALDAGFSLAI